MADRPRRTYLVCATPRSGSTLLCETLRATGVAGRPLEHFEVMRHSGLPPQPRAYFPDPLPPGLEELLAPDPAPNPGDERPQEWWARVLEMGTDEDREVWGGKLMWGHVPDFLERAHELPGLAGADLDAVLTALLGEDLPLLFVTRPDKVAQAVSLWRAVQTQAWRAADGDSGPDGARWSFPAILHLVELLESHDAAWRRWFAATGRTPLELTFDELAEDTAGAVGRALAHVGLPAHDVPAPATRKQGDDRNAEWIARFREEAKERPAA